jgi:O-succinylbenzoic acid--CoA ligase
VVAAAGPPSLDELRDAVKAELPPWCAPKELVLVDSLPRTALGKLRRSALRTTA